MEYNLNINQRAVYELGLQDKLDAIDLLLFDFIYNLMNDPKSIKSTIRCSDGKERVFTMIKPKLVSEECPILNINNRVTFTKRISRLVDAGLIIRYERNQAEGWSFYARGELFMVFKKGDVNCFTPCKQSLTLSVNDDLHYHNTIEHNISPVTLSNDKDNVPKGERVRFVKPTVNEIASYCRERNNNIDAQEFYDFYESKGWVIGKSPMKDWKAAVRTWEKNHKKSQSQQENHVYQ